MQDSWHGLSRKRDSHLNEDSQQKSPSNSNASWRNDFSLDFKNELTPVEVNESNSEILTNDRHNISDVDPMAEMMDLLKPAGIVDMEAKNRNSIFQEGPR